MPRTATRCHTPSAIAAATAGLLLPAGLASGFDRTFNISLVSQYNPLVQAGLRASTPNQYADVGADGNLAALGSIDGTGVAFIDIANPAAPVFKSYYNPAGGEGGQFEDVVIRGNFAFAAIDNTSNRGGVHVLNVSNPSSPVKLTEITQANGGFYNIHTLFLDGDYLYEASNSVSTVKVFNVANPSAPVFVRDIITGGPAGDNLHQVTVKNGRLYTSNITSGLMEIYDIRDVGSGSWTTAGRRIASFNPGARNHSSWVSDDGNLLAIAKETTNGDVGLWNIANPAAPVLVSSITRTSAGIDAFTPHNPMIVGDTLYVSWYQAGLQVFNIRNPASPVHLGAFDTYAGNASTPGQYLSSYDGNWGLDVSRGNGQILLSDFDNGLFIVDATAAFKKTWTYAADDNGRWQGNANWAAGAGPFPNSSEMTASFTSPSAGAARTVTVDGAIGPATPRAAAVEFLGSLSYTVSAANGGGVELRSTAGPATITVLPGANSTGVNRLLAPVTLADDALVVANHSNRPSTASAPLQIGPVQATAPGAHLTFRGAGRTALTAAVTWSGPVTVDGGNVETVMPLTVNGPLTLASGTMGGAGDVTASGGLTVTGDSRHAGPGTLHVSGGGLSLAAGAVLDMTTTDLLVAYTGASPYAHLRGQVRQGIATSGAEGIAVTQTAENDRVLALVDAMDINATSWNGIPISPATVVGKYTFFGDGNLDGKITGEDYGPVDANLGQLTDKWIRGDYNLDGKVSGEDYGYVDANLGKGSTDPLAYAALKGEMVALHTQQFGQSYLDVFRAIERGETPVPEPQAAAAVILAAAFLRRRRRAV